LLLLELDAIRFSKEYCIAYLLLLARRIDAAAWQTDVADNGTSIGTGTSSGDTQGLATVDGAVVATSTTSALVSTSASSSAVSTNASSTPVIPQVNVEALRRVLEAEIAALQEVMYMPSPDGGTVPKGFRDVDPLSLRALNLVHTYNLEDDGIELIA
jgi:hypothetical protein